MARGPKFDENAITIASALEQLIAGGGVKTIRRGGYALKRGRGRVIVAAIGG